MASLDGNAAEIARHWHAAHDAKKAFPTLLRAAEVAARFAFAEELRMLALALELWSMADSDLRLARSNCCTERRSQQARLGATAGRFGWPTRASRSCTRRIPTRVCVPRPFGMRDLCPAADSAFWPGDGAHAAPPLPPAPDGSFMKWSYSERVSPGTAWVVVSVGVGLGALTDHPCGCRTLYCEQPSGLASPRRLNSATSDLPGLRGVAPWAPESAVQPVAFSSLARNCSTSDASVGLAARRGQLEETSASTTAPLRTMSDRPGGLPALAGMVP
jgi:hypothetical protein